MRYVTPSYVPETGEVIPDGPHPARQPSADSRRAVADPIRPHHRSRPPPCPQARSALLDPLPHPPRLAP